MAKIREFEVLRAKKDYQAIREIYSSIFVSVDISSTSAICRQ
jgi:hypothetical protein